MYRWRVEHRKAYSRNSAVEVTFINADNMKAADAALMASRPNRYVTAVVMIRKVQS